MRSQLMFLDCPAYLGNGGAARCGLPAEVEYRYTVGSTDGPLECAKIRCPRGHRFNRPIEFLSLRKLSPLPAPARRTAAEGSLESGPATGSR